MEKTEIEQFLGAFLEVASDSAEHLGGLVDAVNRLAKALELNDRGHGIGDAMNELAMSTREGRHTDAIAHALKHVAAAIEGAGK